MKILNLLLLLFTLVVFQPVWAGDCRMKNENAKYFDTPKQAVAVINKLLIEEDWETLSQYYDLSCSGIEKEELESGRYFVRSESELPASTHPAVSGKSKGPFTPGFEYSSHEDVGDGKVSVRVSIKIDQGDGMMQIGWQEFMMKIYDKGYMILARD